MNIAFYAPLKPPTHPVPSGDRVIARLLVEALELSGHQVQLACKFRSREPDGNREQQVRLQRVADAFARRLLRRYGNSSMSRRPQAWFTYHLYYKAPDFLGPQISAALGIPYIVAEASYALKRCKGPWAQWNAHAGASIRAAHRVIALNRDDVPGITPLMRSPQCLEQVAPFIDTELFSSRGSIAQRYALASQFNLDPEQPWLLAVAMMRRGRKVACFRLLARALEGLTHEPWQLLLVGDGEGAAEVRGEFERLRGRTRFLGVKPREALAQIYANADIFSWPAIGEPLGLVFLEAQASGLPVVAGDPRGVPDLVRHDQTGLLVPEGDIGAYRAALRALLKDPARRARFSAAGRRYVDQHHSLASAANRLNEILKAALGELPQEEPQGEPD